jgi:hypothetical protein
MASDAGAARRAAMWGRPPHCAAHYPGYDARMAMPTLPRIAIATRDPAGIGPEISFKAALDPAVRALCRPLLMIEAMRHAASRSVAA